MESASVAHSHAAHPPEANHSSRVESQLLGVLLFIISEAMLFGSFFTAYFFIRIVGDTDPWPPDPFEFPKAVAGMNTVLLLVSSGTMHYALHSIKNNNRLGLKAGLVSTLALGSIFLITQINEYVKAGFSIHDGAFASVFYGLTGLHGLHVLIGLTLLSIMTLRTYRGHFRPDAHMGVECAGIYWHFVDVMWIIVYTTVYLL
jgi:cytochrome c oxidase subunit 3